LGDGRILIDMRQETGATRWLAESADHGMTWTNVRPGIKVTPVACAIKRLTDWSAGDDRAWLLWTGPEGAERRHLVIRTSADEGKSFQNERLISDDFAAYSDLVLLKDGTAGVLWERGVKENYEFITFTRLNRQWLDSVLRGHSTQQHATRQGF
jgi:sialidase-1